jgi:hypothetical protein
MDHELDKSPAETREVGESNASLDTKGIDTNISAVDGVIVRGAREHNLKGVDVIVPRDSMTVITGLSGSG